MAQLPLDIAQTLGLRGVGGEGAHRTGEVGAHEAGDPAHFTAVGLGEADPVGRAVAPAVAVLDGELLLVRDLGGLHQVMNPRHVDGHGFLSEDVLAGLDALAKHHGAVSRGSGHQDHVHVGGGQFLEGVEPGELAVLGDLHALLAEGGPQGLERALDFLGEGVGHGPELHLVVGFQGLGGSTRSASAASDQAHLDGVAAADLGAADVREASDGGGSRGGGGGLYEVASGGVGGVAHGVVTVRMGGYGRVSTLPFKILDPQTGG